MSGEKIKYNIKIYIGKGSAREKKVGVSCQNMIKETKEGAQGGKRVVLDVKCKWGIGRCHNKHLEKRVKRLKREKNKGNKEKIMQIKVKSYVARNTG